MKDDYKILRSKVSVGANIAVKPGKPFTHVSQVIAYIESLDSSVKCFEIKLDIDQFKIDSPKFTVITDMAFVNNYKAIGCKIDDECLLCKYEKI